MRIYIDERILVVIGIVLVFVGFIMALLSVAFAAALFFALPSFESGVVAVMVAFVMVVLTGIFIKDPFFWVVWIVLVAVCAIPLYGWWSLIILGGLISAGIFTIISS